MRSRHLDGLRGLAALTVVFCHLCCAYIPGLYFGSSIHPVQDALSRSVFFVFYSGTFAVYVFFVLSGFVISSSASKKTESFFDTIGKRYLRLAVPALFSGVFAYIMWCVFPGITEQFGQELPNSWIWSWFSGSPPRTIIAIWDPLFNCFRFGWASINRVLWTMQVELFGSISIYFAYRVIPRKFLLPFFVVCLLALIPQRQPWVNFIGFPAGAILFLANESRSLKSSAWGALLIAGGFLLGSLPQQENVGEIFQPLIAILSGLADPNVFILTLGAIMIVAGVLIFSTAQSFLSNRIPVFLGRISFMLYLLHAPLILLPGVALTLFFRPSITVLLCVSALMLVAAIATASVFTVWIDEPLLKFLRQRSLGKVTIRVAGLIGVEWAMFATMLIYYLSRIGIDPLAIVILAIANLGVVFVFKHMLTRETMRS